MGSGDLSEWSGNIEEFGRKAAEIAGRGLPDDPEPTIRLIRDYLQRGILGPTRKSGREIEFHYDNLLRFLAARVLLRDGWPLAKISQHFDSSTQTELEALVPWLTNRAIGVLAGIKQGSAGTFSESDSQQNLRRRVAHLSGIKGEMREAMRRLGLPIDGVATEQMMLIALAPWCQVFVQSDRLDRLTVEDAEDLGRSLTASLLDISTRKGRK